MTDCGSESATVGENGTLVCTAHVEFADNKGTNAVITVECVDTKLASNVRDCITNLAAAAAPLEI
jgi:succinate dehydrogenase/fumarate reductase-like Fe-S protein